MNNKLIRELDKQWAAISREAAAKRRALESGDLHTSDLDGCGQPALRAVPPFMQAETDLDQKIRECGKRARERFQRRIKNGKDKST